MTFRFQFTWSISLIVFEGDSVGHETDNSDEMSDFAEDFCTIDRGVFSSSFQLIRLEWIEKNLRFV